MDWNLWGSCHDQDTQESTYHMEDDWPRHFSFCYGIDVLEEDALNEQACTQVLRILIAKADTEIVEREEELVILQAQLAWFDEDWSELCSNTLKEKIDCLNISIRKCTTKNVLKDPDLGDCTQTPGEPAENIHNILQGLLRNYSQRKDMQSVDVIAKGSSVDHPVYLIDGSLERKQLNNTFPNVIRSKEAKRTYITSAEKGAISVTLLRPEKTSDYGTIKHVGVTAHYSNLKLPGNAASLILESGVIECDSEINRKKDDSRQTSTPKFEYIAQKSSLRTQVKKKPKTEAVTPQSANMSSNSTPGTFEGATSEAGRMLKQSKGLKAGIHKGDTSRSSLNKEKGRVVPLELVEAQVFSTVDAEPHSAPVDSLIELLKQGKKQNAEAKKKRRLLQKAEIHSTNLNSSFDPSLKPQWHQPKRDQHTIESIREPCLSAELGLNPYSQQKYKMQWKSGVSGGSVSFSQSANEKKKAPEEHIDDSVSLISYVRKKRKEGRREKKESTSLPLVDGICACIPHQKHHPQIHLLPDMLYFFHPITVIVLCFGMSCNRKLFCNSNGRFVANLHHVGSIAV